MKILLINPKFPPSYWGQEYSGPITGYTYVFPPLGLATVASLSAPHHVEIIDENVEKIDFEYAKQFDIVGLTGYMIQSEREFEICDELRSRGIFVAIGGPNAYLIKEDCREHCDVLIAGEAERTWPKFLKDFEQGEWQNYYEEAEKISLDYSPIPRFDLIKLSKYTAGIIQTTRGCPFTCDFCDIIVMYGRKVREKPVEQVIQEIDALRLLGKNNIFFADDNFIGNKRYAKQLLRAIKDYNNLHNNSLEYYTQVSMNLAHDEELLQLMYDCRFLKVFIGIESPRKSSLEGASKGVNTRNDLLTDVRKIQSYNILIMAGMIVGFDSDDREIFQEQVDFLQAAGIPYAMVGTLQAIPHTPLYDRLKRENRLIDCGSGNNFASTNIVPKLMTFQQLIEGYNWLASQLYTVEKFTKR
ncbi:MAG: B12-binding domain-containing radical SAM protein, partial [Spirochaetota bacterium]|nr:B12-binding domain-containing radical SAM protein [Spirochaetota bacterium]